MFATPNTGLVAADRIFSDDDPKDIDASTPDSALHRNVDLVVLKADEEGYVKTHIVLPSTIWGVASNPIVDAGIANRFSIQVPALIKAALDRKQAGIIGKGQAVWTAVNVNERKSPTVFSNITPISDNDPQRPNSTFNCSTPSPLPPHKSDTVTMATTSARTASTPGTISPKPSARPLSSAVSALRKSPPPSLRRSCPSTSGLRRSLASGDPTPVSSLLTLARSAGSRSSLLRTSSPTSMLRSRRS